MSYLGSLVKKVGDKITAAIGGAIVVLVGVAWLWLYNRMNPEFSYEAVPSSGASHFVGLANVLKQIDKDSHVYCSGGWDQRIARLALRRCYEFSFVPEVAYSTYACSADPAAISVFTSDQLVALRRFEKRFDGCLIVSQGNSETSYESDGPTATPPTHRGFGTRIMESIIGQLRGEVRFDWRDQGLTCEIALPLA